MRVECSTCKHCTFSPIVSWGTCSVQHRGVFYDGWCVYYSYKNVIKDESQQVIRDKKNDS